MAGHTQQSSTSTHTFDERVRDLRRAPRRWLVTGGAGFIGSNLAHALLELDQTVVVVDNFATGRRSNIDDLDRLAGQTKGEFRFIEGDIRDPQTCHSVCAGAHYVLHEAALGSVPRSLKDPLATHQANATGFLNMLIAARDAKCARFVYAGSSSTYGDDPNLPKREDVIGRPLSPYAVTKYMDELYARVFAQHYHMSVVGLRYFNVFGPRQDPNGAYAAVIPLWIAARLRGDAPHIFGDGSTSRDFCYIDNVVRANILAATTPLEAGTHEIFNVAVGATTTLLDLLAAIDDELLRQGAVQRDALVEPTFASFRNGDIQHSLADISKAQRLLGYAPTHRLREGLARTVPWFLKEMSTPRQSA